MRVIIGAVIFAIVSTIVMLGTQTPSAKAAIYRNSSALCRHGEDGNCSRITRRRKAVSRDLIARRKLGVRRIKFKKFKVPKQTMHRAKRRHGSLIKKRRRGRIVNHRYRVRFSRKRSTKPGLRRHRRRMKSYRK